MKKLLLLLGLMCVLAVQVPAQSLDPNLLDFSKAQVSLAGPDRVYVRSIYYGGTGLSVLLVYDGAFGATIYGPYLDADKVLLDSYELGYASLWKKGTNQIVVADIILGGAGYSGTLKWDGAENLTLLDYIATTTPKTYEQQIAELKNELIEVSADYAELKSDYETGEKTYQAGEQEYNKLVSDYRTAQNQIASLKKDLASAGVTPTSVEIAMPSRTVLSGFGNGKSLFGSWSVTASSAKQTDSTQKYAKFAIPVTQNASRSLFGITAKATGSDWVGYGLHFLASGSKLSKGYGFGSSYLVWVTRDPDYYDTDKSFVQLYRSSDDVSMVQLASIMIPQSITSSMKTEVLFDRSAKTLTVYIAGAEVISIEEETSLWSGDSIALRTLGGIVEFTGLTVKQ